MTHFKGAYFESNFLKQANYFNSAELMSYKYMAHVNMKPLESTRGDVVYTDQKMYLFKKWFDREIPNTNAKVFIPDLGQAKLEGAQILNIDDLPRINDDTKSVFLKNKQHLINETIKPDFERINSKVDLILSKSGDIKEICKKIVSLIPENGEINPSNIKTIDSLEKKLINDEEIHEVSNVISSSAQDILLSIMENIEYSDDEKSSAWIKTRMLYKSIINLTDFYTKCLKKMLKTT
jgi:hypothetical protein